MKDFNRTILGKLLLESPEPDGCLVYPGYRDKNGYGRLEYRLGPGKFTTYAHVAAWHVEGRLTPPGLELDHTCHNPGCVNVNHLRAVTHQVNLRNRARDPMVCVHGHPKNQTASGRVYCKTCAYAAVKAWRAGHPDKARRTDKLQKRAWRARVQPPR